MCSAALPFTPTLTSFGWTLLLVSGGCGNDGWSSDGGNAMDRIIDGAALKYLK